MRVILLIVVSAATTLFTQALRARDVVRHAVPYRCLEPLLPEDLPALDYPQYAGDLDRAKLESFRGRYRKSLYTLDRAVNPDPVEAALVKGRSLAALGRHDEAIEALSGDPVRIDPRVAVMRATVLAELGRHADALAVLDELLKAHPDLLQARYLVGALHEERGDLDKARQAFGWFVAQPQDFLEKWKRDREKTFDDAEQVTIIGRAIDRWATLTGAYEKIPELHQTLSELFVRAYDVIDRGYWPARVASAEYFLSHDNSFQAGKELEIALEANPNDARAHELVATMALDEWDFDGVEKAIASIRRVDPASIAADVLEARSLLRQRRPLDAARPVERVLVAQPDHLEALGLLAAVHALQLQEDKTADVLKRVDRLDPDNATAYFEVADQLAAMRQYPRAISLYRTAVERAPWWTAARNGLGLIYTQSGDEDEAQKTLDAAHALDPFNLRTTNYLRLLDGLSAFARKETEHFVVMYDAQLDPLIPEYFAEYLESIHADVCRTFAHEPAVKTLIEVFPTHDAFSVRTTGSPWIGTVGASTGRVIALVSPRQGEMTMGAFNWAQVLRHEYTHTVTLSATDNRIPHWMTEGLAVLQEEAPMRWEWVPMLYNAVTKDELFTMDALTWGFVRPKRPNDRSLAYAQSFWVCRYIEETWGHDAILKMLEEFRAGRGEEETFHKVLDRGLSEFTSGFFAWARQQVSTWGYDEETTKKYEELRERAEGMVKGRQFEPAVELWNQIAQLRPMDALPHQRLAGLYLAKEVNRPGQAIEHLKILHAVSLKDNRYAKRVARVYRDTGKVDDAQAFALQAVYVDPYDLDGHQLLAELYEKSGNAAGLERERRVIPVLQKWHEANRKRLQLQP